MFSGTVAGRNNIIIKINDGICKSLLIISVAIGFGSEAQRCHKKFGQVHIKLTRVMLVRLWPWFE